MSSNAEPPIGARELTYPMSAFGQGETKRERLFWGKFKPLRSIEFCLKQSFCAIQGKNYLAASN